MSLLSLQSAVHGRQLRSVVFLIFIFPAMAFAAFGKPIDPAGPIQAAIVNIGFAKGMCTGVVIGPHTVLSGAHCPTMFKGDPLTVAHLSSGGTSKCEVSDVVETALVPGAVRDIPGGPMAPEGFYSPDLLLIRIKDPLCGVTPAAIAEESLRPNDLAFSAGHGRGPIGRTFGEAYFLEIKFIESSQASAAISPLPPSSEEFLAVGARTQSYSLPVVPGTTTCWGDSGGPVYREENGKMVVYGINTAFGAHDKLGNEGCDYAYLQIVTQVAPHSAWVKSKIAEWN